MTGRSLYRCAALTLFLCVLTGCSDGRPERVPLQGTVLIDGEPLRYGFVQVVPEDGRPAQSQINSEGQFVLGTYDDADGCLPGTHKVAVIGMESLSPTEQKWHAPKKYQSVETSELTITVGKSQEPVTINLTWAGGKPFIDKTQAE